MWASVEPLRSPDDAPSGTPSAELAAPPPERLRLLIVEDSFLTAMHLKRMIQSLGCEAVGPAANVRDALAIVESRELDGALLDINLGAESVVPVADRLAALGVPFVFVSGFASPSIADPRFQGARLLAKPVDLRLLTRAIAEEFRT